MAKSKYKPSKAQSSATSQQGESKKRKIQSFRRVSISSNPQQKKRKLPDTDYSQKQQQQQQTWKDKPSTGKKNTHQQELHQRPTIPYEKKDRILLIGEGDFSFARSLYEHHRCKNVFATCYDSKDTLLSKYQGQAEANIKEFLNYGDEDEEEKSKSKGETGPLTDAETTEQENDEEPKQDIHEDEAHTKKKVQPKDRSRKVLYSVDARKLGASLVGGGKDVRKGIPRRAPRRRNDQPKTGKKGQDNDEGPWDIISFNFPHVGGISTDVNRQVRANQELLVAFFKACVPLLSRHSSEDEDQNKDYNDYDDDEYGDFTNSEDGSDSSGSNPDNAQSNIRTISRQSGQIIVTIFEGEPYTLWNVKDLARHAGLQVVTSFKFPWKAYPGYSHARTLGIVECRNKKSDDGKAVGGGWKGEDREARTYVFEVKRDSNQRQKPHQRHALKSREDVKGNKQRKGGEDDSSDED